MKSILSAGGLLTCHLQIADFGAKTEDVRKLGFLRIVSWVSLDLDASFHLRNSGKVRSFCRSSVTESPCMSLPGNPIPRLGHLSPGVAFKSFTSTCNQEKIIIGSMLFGAFNNKANQNLKLKKPSVSNYYIRYHFYGKWQQQ